MEALRENQAASRHVDTPEFRYPLRRQRRRQPSGAEPAQLEPSTSRELESAGLRHKVAKRGRFWNVIDPRGALVCVTVYKRGALEVSRRLDAHEMASVTAPL